MTSSIVKPSDYNIENLTFKTLMSQKRKQHKLSYCPLIMALGAHLSNYLQSTLICMVFRPSVIFIRRTGSVCF